MTDPQRELQASHTTQHGSAAAAAAGDAPASAPAPAAPDAARCIVHIDVDCFYAQCEEHRNPALRGRPLGVTQKYLLVRAAAWCPLRPQWGGGDGAQDPWAGSGAQLQSCPSCLALSTRSPATTLRGSRAWRR